MGELSHAEDERLDVRDMELGPHVLAIRAKSHEQCSRAHCFDRLSLCIVKQAARHRSKAQCGREHSETHMFVCAAVHQDSGGVRRSTPTEKSRVHHHFFGQTASITVRTWLITSTDRSDYVGALPLWFVARLRHCPRSCLHFWEVAFPSLRSFPSLPYLPPFPFG